MVTEPITVFCCSAQNNEDRVLQDELIRHLSSLKRQRIISEWHDYYIEAGQEREKAISTNLRSARLILLLISPDFFSSDYCVETLQEASNMQIAGKARVVLIILRPCDWKQSSLESLHVLPEKEKAITLWSNRDEAWLSVVMGIRDVIAQVLSQKLKTAKKPRQKKGSHHKQVFLLSQQTFDMETVDEIASPHHKTIDTKRAILHFHAFMQENSTIRIFSLIGEAYMGKTHLLTKVFPGLASQHYQAHCVVLDMRNPVHPVPTLLQIASSQLGSTVSDNYAKCYELWLEHHAASGKEWRDEDRYFRDFHLTSCFVKEIDKLGTGQLVGHATIE